MNKIKSIGAFCCIFLYQAMLRGNQHGGREYDDLQNSLDMSSHETLSSIVPLAKLQNCWGMHQHGGLCKDTCVTWSIFPQCGIHIWCSPKVAMSLLVNYFKEVLHPWALFLKTSCNFLKNNAILDKLSYGSGLKCSKELKYSFSKDHCCEVKVKNVQKSIFSMFWTINH